MLGFPPTCNGGTSSKQSPLCYVVTGVSGSGKSTVGKLLARRLRCPFYDGDDFHPQRNIDKMRSGEALTDSDRAPWLQTLAHLLQKHVKHSKSCVVACSCLKSKYRDAICGGASRGRKNSIAFVLLQPTEEELRRRVYAREAAGGHFMPPALLTSQLEELEVDSSIPVFRSASSTYTVEEILRTIGGTQPPQR